MVAERRTDNFALSPYLDLRQRLEKKAPDAVAAIIRGRVRGDFATDVQEHVLWMAHGRSETCSIHDYGGYIERTDPRSGRKRLLPLNGDGSEDMIVSLARYYLEQRAAGSVLAEGAYRELRAFGTLRRNVFDSPDGSLIFWMSPKREHYDYTVMYVGHIERIGPYERHIHMYSLYDKKSTLPLQARILCYLKPEIAASRLTPETILANPVVLTQHPLLKKPQDLMAFIRLTLKHASEITEDTWRSAIHTIEGIIQQTKLLIAKVTDVIEEAVSRFTRGVLEKKPLVVLGNIHRRLREDVLRAVSPAYRSVPSWILDRLIRAQTSCPTSSSKASSLEKLIGDYIACPSCGKNVRRGSHQCEHCGTRNEGCGDAGG